MPSHMLTLVVIGALAIYNDRAKGIVPAIAYMLRSGMDIFEATDVLATYDRYVDAVKADIFP